MKKERCGNCWVMRSAIFLLFLLYAFAPVSCIISSVLCVSLNVPTYFSGRMAIRVCVVLCFRVFLRRGISYIYLCGFPLGSWALVWPRGGSLRSANVTIQSINQTMAVSLLDFAKTVYWVLLEILRNILAGAYVAWRAVSWQVEQLTSDDELFKRSPCTQGLH